MMKTNSIRSKTMAFVAVAALCAGTVSAQESANASGGDASGSGGSVAYSVGQVVYTTNTGSSGTVTQGVQQPYEILTVGVATPGMDISLNAFPNPTTDRLTLQVGEDNLEGLSYQLYDLHGKLLSSARIVDTQTQVEMGNLAMTTYFLNVLNNEGKQIQSFKILKN
jgi:2',3'-cyclic-nucleotide 2'-phosphodiesterase (5'-nucleotidase family)